MNKSTVTYGTFVVERRFKAPPERVFAAFASKAAKDQWFKGPPEWKAEPGVFDFRVDGEETNHGGIEGKFWSEFWCRYQDIVPNERIVYCYRMRLNGVPMSASLAVIEIRPDGDGALLTLTENGAFFDGYSGREHHQGREHGTNILMDQLVALLDG